MNILLLNQYFPPDTSATARMAALIVDALARRHRVMVLAGRPSYEPELRHPRYLLRRKRCGRVIVERMGSTTFPRHRMSRRLSNYLSYLGLAVPRALAANADVVLAMTDPPVVGIAGALVARLRRRPFIYNVRDLYPEMALAAGMVRPARWVRGWERLHCWALSQAHRVIVLGDDMRERILSKGLTPERVVVVRDGAPVPAEVPCSEHPITREIRGDFPFVVLHAGNLGFYGAWETLIRATALLDGDGVGLVFVGDGSSRRSVEAMACGSPRVRFLPYRPPAEVPYVLAAADMHLVTVRRGLEGVVVPSKLYPILAAGRPILAVAPDGSDVARIVRETGCGLVADPGDPEAVAAAVRRAVSDPAGLREMARRARAAAPRYDREAQLEEFVRVIEQVSPL